MVHLLLVMIYLAFISLGLPDSLLGSAWPSAYPELGVPVSASGIIFLLISLGTVISSLNSDRLIRRFSTGTVTALSTLLSALTLFGFSISTKYIHLCLLALPYGLAAGSIDTALNNYVALHYKSRHMSWLHCMWGIGASLGPLIMSAALSAQLGWQAGYRRVGWIQLALSALLLCALPLWKKGSVNEESIGRHLSLQELFQIPGVKELLLTFFCYCAFEQSSGLWAATWLSGVKGIDKVLAARFASLFYSGITLGRAFSGFLTLKLNDRQMVRCGMAVILAGLFCLMQNFSDSLSLAGLVIIGAGCAPIFPSLIHAVPDSFGTEYSQQIIGVQMASAYLGTSFMPPFFGFLAQQIGLWILPLYLSILAGCMILFHEALLRKTGK